MNGELIIGSVTGSVTYRDGGDLRCSRCRNMCRAHYAAKFDSESFTRNDVCLECAAGAIVDAEMLKAQDERETRMFREAMAADDLAEPPLLTDALATVRRVEEVIAQTAADPNFGKCEHGRNPAWCLPCQDAVRSSKGAPHVRTRA